jgi:hypothetical protein
MAQAVEQRRGDSLSRAGARQNPKHQDRDKRGRGDAAPSYFERKALVRVVSAAPLPAIATPNSRSACTLV